MICDCIPSENAIIRNRKILGGFHDTRPLSPLHTTIVYTLVLVYALLTFWMSRFCGANGMSGARLRNMVYLWSVLLVQFVQPTGRNGTITSPTPRTVTVLFIYP